MPALPASKTDEEHLKFLQSLSALKVRFALDWATAHPGGFARALAERTFFFNLGAWHRGDIYDNPEADDAGRRAWEAFLAQAEVLGSEANAEQAILALLPSAEEYFLPRVARDQSELHHPVRGLAARPGCLWTFAAPGPLALPEDPKAPRVLEFHIANHAYPGSFLKDPDGVRQEVRALAQRAQDLGFEGIGTRSWLNDLPAWLDCFPPVWSARRTPQGFDQVGGHLGCWGQVVTARQTLSSHADRFLRDHRRFEFAMRATWMTVEEALSSTGS